MGAIVTNPSHNMQYTTVVDHPTDRVMPGEHQIMNNDTYHTILTKLTLDHPCISATLIADTLDQAIHEIDTYNQIHQFNEAL